MGLIIVPISGKTSQGSMKQTQPNGTINDFFQGESQVKQHDVVLGVFPILPFELWNA